MDVTEHRDYEPLAVQVARAPWIMLNPWMIRIEIGRYVIHAMLNYGLRHAKSYSNTGSNPMDKEYETTITTIDLDGSTSKDIPVIVHYEMDGYKPLINAIYRHPSKGFDIDLMPVLSAEEYERVYNEVLNNEC